MPSLTPASLAPRSTVPRAMPDKSARKCSHHAGSFSCWLQEPSVGAAHICRTAPNVHEGNSNQSHLWTYCMCAYASSSVDACSFLAVPQPAPFCFLWWGLPGLSRAHWPLPGPSPPHSGSLWPPSANTTPACTCKPPGAPPSSKDLGKVQVTHHQLILGSGDGGQDVDAVGREVASVFAAVVDAVSPARVHHMFSIMFIQNDQIPFGETEEGGVDSCCEAKQTYGIDSGCRHDSRAWSQAAVGPYQG